MTGTADPGPRRPVRPRVAIIGAGLTGLATAWLLRGDAAVTVFDAAGHEGGQIRTVPVAGVPLDVGADAFLARQPEAEALVRSLGFGDDDLVAPLTGRVHLWVRGRLRPMPAGTVLGAPSSVRALGRSGVLGPGGLARAALEPVAARRFVPGDRSVADLLGERFGRQVVDTLVEPLLGGVYAGAVDRLSAQATMPAVWAASRGRGSLARALAEHRRTTADDPRPVFLTLRHGLASVPQRLRERLGDRVLLRTPVTGIARTADGWSVATGSLTPRAADEVFDAVVLAVPAAAAARIVEDLDAEVARELAGIRAASVGVVALAYDPADARAVPPGSGVLVPRAEGHLVKAITVSSRKWPHHRDHGGVFLLRASVGRVDDRRALQLDDATLADRVDAEVRWALGIERPARERVVVRWPDALPQYEVGHLGRVERIRHAAAQRLPGLAIGGAALDGVGLAARSRDAARLAHEVREHLTRARRRTPVDG